MMDTTIFAQRLKEARISANLTQAKLCKLSGVTSATISAYESFDGNKGKNPSLDNALKLARALNVSIDWLCGYKKEFKVSDFVKQLVLLSDEAQITVDKFYLEDCETSLPEAFVKLSENKNEWYISTKKNKRMFSTITIADYDIQTFLKDWLKIKNLYDNKIIDKNLYSLWLKQQFRNMDSEQKEIPLFPELISSDE